MFKRLRNILGILLSVMGISLSLYSFQAAQQAKAVHYSAAHRGNRVFHSAPEDLNRDGLNINTAGFTDLIQLPGIKDKLAHEIILEREENGPFHYPEDLVAVKGIGQSKMRSIQELLVFSVSESEDK